MTRDPDRLYRTRLRSAAKASVAEGLSLEGFLEVATEMFLAEDGDTEVLGDGLYRREIATEIEAFAGRVGFLAGQRERRDLVDWLRGNEPWVRSDKLWGLRAKNPEAIAELIEEIETWTR